VRSIDTVFLPTAVVGALCILSLVRVCLSCCVLAFSSEHLDSSGSSDLIIGTATLVCLVLVGQLEPLQAVVTISLSALRSMLLLGCRPLVEFDLIFLL